MSKGYGTAVTESVDQSKECEMGGSLKVIKPRGKREPVRVNMSASFGIGTRKYTTKQKGEKSANANHPSTDRNQKTRKRPTDGSMYIHRE